MATTRRELSREEQRGQSTSSLESTRAGDTRSAGSTNSTQSNGQQQGLMNINEEQLARGLGWFSIGLGLAEALTPGAIGKISGIKGNRGFIRLMGLREIAHGLAIFAQGKRPATALWARVAGDALDLAALGAAFASPRNQKGKLAFATANVLAVTALDVICAQALSSRDSAKTGGTVRNSLIINRAPEELYQFWRDFENLPRFMPYLESVQITGEGRSHWVAKAPADTSVEWDAEITEDRPNELISWRSLEGADVDNSGTVRFEPAPGNRGTIVKVDINYNPPGGVIGAAVAKLMGDDPGAQAMESLRCFKQLMETGEIVVSDGTVWDNGLLTQRPAQPATDDEIRRAEGFSTSRAASR
jgi:uncharacterized membrane protein